ncbi:hypothetical protein BDN71DRAFT_1458680 [Pleurotus eryngii]|uniref:Uncharacterized protein n=1 Tax=Pleurotus eryngii TaxID=5323 RepID=A0A9P5ZHH1_PLEER|nr:hypothetical protein BDN71DRAFT_1458680 [Pleurotus eryngii]
MYDPARLRRLPHTVHVLLAQTGGIRALPEDVVSNLETLSADISKEIPSVDQVELRHVLINFGHGCTLPVPLSSCATYKGTEIIFRRVTGHVTSEIHCFVDSSDGRVIGRSQFNELVTSRQATQETVFVPIWSNEYRSGDKTRQPFHSSKL